MADEDSSAEKTEEPTSRRLEQAREEGQIARSRELNTTALLLAGSAGLLIYGPSMSDAMARLMRHNFDIPRDAIFDTGSMINYLASSFYLAGTAVAPLMILAMLAAMIGPIALGGWLFSSKALMPKMSRLDPLAGIKRMFSANSLVELGKGIAKVSLIGFVSYLVVKHDTDLVINLDRADIEAAMVHSLELTAWAALLISASTILIAIIDVPYQMWDHNKKLRMSLQEIKDEMKDTEGKPEVKGRIRQLQHEMARRRMMAQVPEADVVITNPEHFSVALKYDQSRPGAPILVAKGIDETAMKIREIANANNVKIFPAPPLARAIYYTTKLDQEIPEGLYLAVAQVLAYVYQLKTYKPGRSKKPVEPKEFRIPDSMRYDENGNH
jgi:flagellar biosynthetic protein FlhB